MGKQIYLTAGQAELIYQLIRNTFDVGAFSEEQEAEFKKVMEKLK